MIRLILEKDYPQVFPLHEYAFQYQLTEEKKKIKQKRKMIGYFNDNKLLAKLEMIDFKVWIDDKVWSMGGVAGVATWPEHRRGNKVKELLHISLQMLRDQKISISFLHPFQIGFYRKYGWELFCNELQINIPVNDLTFLNLVEREGHVTRVDVTENLLILNEVYEQFAKKYNGMLERSKEWWKDSVLPDQNCAGYYNHDSQLMGYILYEINNGKLIVQEFISLNVEAKKGLWNFICQHDSMITEVELTCSNHDNILFMLPNPKVRSRLDPYFMARIVDIELFLSQYHFNECDESVIIHLTDDFALWNQGTVIIKKGNATFYPVKEGSNCTHPPKKGLHINIGPFTALLLGYKTAFELSEIGMIHGTDKEMGILQSVITKNKTFFYDYF
ncbi:GNAT family N-acetyltransferase [Chengkuizengella sediminis]|uniref:GNAT family N-acetyltransferase n=1 Tax=Chengkuizengella sediminis TaxID=1885917 RepID=UPI00138993C1|nr:GNAT family N-acetyltransferase [Chengkuizengella sediminis]NDI36247.1 GNAT family N-acetyltransferase [Chengkuizengella sediminis]